MGRRCWIGGGRRGRLALGGIIVALAARRTTTRQRLAATFRPFSNFLLETSSAVAYLVQFRTMTREDWGQVSQQLTPLSLAVKEALAAVTIDPDVEASLVAEISAALGAAQETTERADTIVVQSLSPKDDQELASLRANLEAKQAIALAGMSTALATRRQRRTKLKGPGFKPATS